jgi:hypothetical protein
MVRCFKLIGHVLCFGHDHNSTTPSRRISMMVGETILEAQRSYMQQSAWDGGRVMLTMRVDCAFLVSV